MQSGITASRDLQDAFNTFTSDSSLFALPITISNESLVPLDPLPFKNDFTSSLSSLKPHVQPKTPIYLFLRKSQSNSAQLIAVTYVPSTAPVRSKTLFASTRSTLVRDLGSEKISEQIFCTDAEEILEASAWQERDASSSAASRNGGGVDVALLSTEERELQRVKRAEEEERHGTQGTQLVRGESESGGATTTTNRDGTSTARSGIRTKITDEAREALRQFAEKTSQSGNGAGGEGLLVQFGIDIATETLTLLSSGDDISPSQVSGKIPGDRPSYAFHHSTSSPGSILFLYVCPGSSKVKERMIYASSRNGALELARSEGVVVSKKLEASDPEELVEPRISEELGLSGGSAGDAPAPSARQGFARPKRPGKK